ncbi:MAG: hypothetical protein ABI895_05880 [Deltaproteobacteria bacterium]
MAGKKRIKSSADTGTLAAQIRQRWGGEGEELELERLEAELDGKGSYDIVAALKELEKAGLGELQVGRKGHKPSFMWAGGGGNAAAPAARPAATRPAATRTGAIRALVPKRESGPPTSARVGPDVLEHSFHVRPRVLATFRLPGDITAQEIERLCQLLEAIPFR